MRHRLPEETGRDLIREGHRLGLNCLRCPRSWVLLAVVPERTRIGEALDSARRGHELNPHDMQSLIGLAYVETIAGNPENAIEHLRQALRVSPRDPMRPNMHQQLTMASFSRSSTRTVSHTPCLG